MNCPFYARDGAFKKEDDDEEEKQKKRKEKKVSPLGWGVEDVWSSLHEDLLQRVQSMVPF